MEQKSENKKEKRGIKKMLSSIGGLFVGILAFVAGLICRRKDVQGVRKGFSNTREHLDGVGQGIDSAKGTLTELNKSVDRSKERVDECQQVLDRIRKEYK